MLREIGVLIRRRQLAREEAKKYSAKTERHNKRSRSSSEAEKSRLAGEVEQPLTDADWLAEGSFSFTLPSEGKPVTVTVTYDSHVDENFQRHYKRRYERPRKVSKPRVRSFRRIQDFALTNGEYTFDLRKDAGDISVYAYNGGGGVQPKLLNSGGSWEEDTNIVFLYRDIRSLRGLAVLLHEIGHAKKDLQLASERTRIPLRDRLLGDTATFGLPEFGKAETIQKERGATAYALSVLRRLVDPQTLVKVKKSLHDSLGSYHGTA